MDKAASASQVLVDHARPVRLDDEPTGDCPTCGERVAYPYSVVGAPEGSGYFDSCRRCAPVAAERFVAELPARGFVPLNG